MKTILLMRHGKSDWSDDRLGDVDRPLSGRGIKGSGRIGKALHRAGCAPELIICSPAARSRATASIVAVACGLDRKNTVEPALYMGDVRAYLAAIRSTPPGSERVLVVGHNPALESFLAELVGGPVSVRLPTAAVACLQAEVSKWEQLGAGCAELLWLITPRLVKRLV